MVEKENVSESKEKVVEALKYLLMGERYFSGISGMSKDLTRARELFEKSASLGNKKAMSYLAKMCALGLGGAKDYNKAQELLESLTSSQDDSFSEMRLLVRASICLANDDIQGYNLINQQVCEMKDARRKKRMLKKENQE